MDKWQYDEEHWSGLMVRAQAGEKAAYNTLLIELGVVIDRYIHLHFGELPNLEDCVQECLLALHRARHTYDPNRLFRPWMFTIVRHKTIDMLRQRQVISEHDVNLESEPSFDTDFDRMIDGQNLLNGLADDQRQAVALTKYLGMTTDEAAVAVGIKEPAMKARLRRGLKTIEKQWQRLGGNEL